MVFSYKIFGGFGFPEGGGVGVGDLPDPVVNIELTEGESFLQAGGEEHSLLAVEAELGAADAEVRVEGQQLQGILVQAGVLGRATGRAGLRQRAHDEDWFRHRRSQ